MKAINYNEIKQDLNDLRENGYQKGYYPGFDGLYDIMSLKMGYPIYIAGAPYSGKTEFLLEILISMSERMGAKHAIFLGETGTPAEIIAELCYKYIRKPFLKKISKNVNNEYAMSDQERFEAEAWVLEHFTIIEDDNSSQFDIWAFYESVKQVEDETGNRFHTTAIDPFVHFDIPDKFGGKEHFYLKSALQFINTNSKQYNRINFVLNHIADLPYQVDKKTGNRFYPKAMPNEWAGGRMWHRFAYQMLLVYRPPSFVVDESGVPLYEENETIVENQKAKPKGSGKLGECKLYWDWRQNRYYEKDDLGITKQAQNEVPF